MIGFERPFGGYVYVNPAKVTHVGSDDMPYRTRVYFSGSEFLTVLGDPASVAAMIGGGPLRAASREL